MHPGRVEGHGRLRGRLEDPALNALLLAAFDATEQGILIHDRDGRIVEANPAAGRLLGVTLEQLLGAVPADPLWTRLRELDGELLDPAHRPATVALATGRPVLSRLLVVHRDDGTDAVVRVDARPVSAGDNRVVVAGLIDVTAESTAQRAAATAHAQVHQTLADVRRLAAEQAAVGRIATAIAEQPDDAAIFALIAAELTRLFDADDAVVVELPADRAPVIRGHAQRGETPPAATGVTHGTTAAVVIGGRTWGYVAVAGARSGDVERRLDGLAELIATAVIAAAARTQLVVEATEDPVTGLLNHRAFHDRLAAEVQRAQRHGRALSLVLIDLDAFKAINDTYGHPAGDRVLQRVGEVLHGVSRNGDVIGRLGGDEFGLVLPETDAAGARLAAERVLELLRSTPVGSGITVTASAGVADLSDADGADRLLQIADGALYRSKARGRDAVSQYTPDSAAAMPARTQDLARFRALTALRGLAAVIDLRDPVSQGHSERVASLAAALATAGEWPAEEITALREAALVHDVGKLAVPATILLSPGPLDAPAYAEVTRHAALGADITAVALTPRQVGWIRHHHERPDGTGYPDGLVGGAIPEGAALMGLAEAWDVMVSGGHARGALSTESAYAECVALEGRQFTPVAIAALRRLHEQGTL